MAPSCPIYAQRLAKRSNGEVPLRTDHGARTIRTRGKNPLPCTRSRLQARPDQSHEASCAASDNTRPTDNDKGNQIQTLRRRPESLAGSDPPKNDTPHSQTQPKKIQTLRDNQEALTRGLSAAHSTAVEDPRRLPRRTPHPIQGDGRAWTKLPRPPPRRHRGRTGVGSGANYGSKTLRTVQTTPIPSQMDRILRCARHLGSCG